jgi:hypothetical protein
LLFQDPDAPVGQSSIYTEEIMDRSKVLYEGVTVGLAGAAAVAIWFFLYDLAAGTPFRTPALLGAAFFEGLRDPAELVVTSGLVLEYTAVHALVFVVFGLAAAGLFALSDYDRHVLFAVFMLFCCFEVAALAAVEVLASWLLQTIKPWSILGANFVAAITMLGILFSHHPRTIGELLTSGE